MSFEKEASDRRSIDKLASFDSPGLLKAGRFATVLCDRLPATEDRASPKSAAPIAGDRSNPNCEAESSAQLAAERRGHSAANESWLTERFLSSWQMRCIEAAIADRPDRSSLKVLATLLGLKECQFYKAFRATTGLPPHQWIMRRRTERAKALLVRPDLSLTEIAYTCGYSSSSHFSTSFGNETGMTPSQFRRQCGNVTESTPVLVNFG